MTIFRTLYCFILLAALCPKSEARSRTQRYDVDLALQAASDLESRGAYDAARRQLMGVLSHVGATEGETLMVRVCEVWQRQNETVQARRCYLDLAPHLTDVERRATARYRAATLATHLAQEALAREELASLVDAMPYTEGARRAFVMARAMYREEGGPEAETDFLMKVASRLAWVSEPGAVHHAEPPAHALLAETLVEVGRIRFSDVHDTAGAQRILERAEAVARGTAWEDDAQIWLARTLRQLERRDEAIVLYNTLVDASEFYDDALFEIAETLEEARRYEEAQNAYAEMFRRVPTSRLLDDAAWRMAELKVRDSGSTAPFTTFLQTYPDSRHARAARNAALLK